MVALQHMCIQEGGVKAALNYVILIRTAAKHHIETRDPTLLHSLYAPHVVPHPSQLYTHRRLRMHLSPAYVYICVLSEALSSASPSFSMSSQSAYRLSPIACCLSACFCLLLPDTIDLMFIYIRWTRW